MHALCARARACVCVCVNVSDTAALRVPWTERPCEAGAQTRLGGTRGSLLPGAPQTNSRGLGPPECCGGSRDTPLPRALPTGPADTPNRVQEGCGVGCGGARTSWVGNKDRRSAVGGSMCMGTQRSICRHVEHVGRGCRVGQEVGAGEGPLGPFGTHRGALSAVRHAPVPRTCTDPDSPPGG